MSAKNDWQISFINTTPNPPLPPKILRAYNTPHLPFPVSWWFIKVRLLNNTYQYFSIVVGFLVLYVELDFTGSLT